MITWIIETEIFSDGDARLVKAAKSQGDDVIHWKDDWLFSQKFPQLSNSKVVFHGSLGNAAQICQSTSWRPGAFCNTAAFYCSHWYPSARQWLLHKQWQLLPARDFVANPEPCFQAVGATDAIFVRPDSPLKPFSGRVLQRNQVSLKAIDHGFYYDDEALPILVAPIVEVGHEWRFVVVNRRVVAGSRYEADSRTEEHAIFEGTQWEYAQGVASEIEPPDRVYVMDVCEADGELKLLELNPFSGADLYACDRHSIVQAIKTLLNVTNQ